MVNKRKEGKPSFRFFLNEAFIQSTNGMCNVINFTAYMKVKKFIIVSLWAGCIGVLGFSAITSAMPYQPEGPIRIITQDIPGSARSVDNGTEWQVETKKTGPGSAELSFSMADSDEVVCRVVMDSVDSASGKASTLNLLWNNPGRQPQVFQQADLLVVPGSPVPCDILPLDMMMGKSEPRNYEIKRQVAGQTFVDTFKVTCNSVGPASARTNGWLTGEDLTGPLVMISVVNARTGELVVRQLWAPGADWWIFEETPYHQSWQLR
ncbi:MAG: hypothetical protein C4518_19650 [Desulfobacteraceae bacterium]|nr:MAG: hypothetical protein C4518_19650 [Desulfobacteraceae bacterium]